MNLSYRAAFALCLFCIAWPTFSADYFWNCTTPDGVKYADASKCDKGDSAVKVNKGSDAVPQPATLPRAILADINKKTVGTNTSVCPTNPAYCTRTNYGVAEGSPRAQAIEQFMRERECDFMQRFPQRCVKPN